MFDAVITALVAGGAAARGLIESVLSGKRETAAQEGWIAVPLEGSLDHPAG